MAIMQELRSRKDAQARSAENQPNSGCILDYRAQKNF